MNTKANLEVVISEEEILSKISEVASKLDKDYADQELVILMIMKGAICLVADLIRRIHMPCSLEFMQGTSYGQLGTERGDLSLFGVERLDIRSKHVLVVDDIYDSGTTLVSIMKRLEELGPASLKSLVLLSKKVEKKFDYKPDYVLFEIDNLFVVGYGLDYKELYRGLPGVYVIGNP